MSAHTNVVRLESAERKSGRKAGWTLSKIAERRVAICRDYWAGMTATELADKYELTEWAIRDALARENRPTSTQVRHAAIKRDACAGNTDLDALAFKYFTSVQTVKRVLADAGIVVPGRARRSELAHVYAERNEEIKSLYRTGKNQSEIAKVIGVSRERIRQLLGKEIIEEQRRKLSEERDQAQAELQAVKDERAATFERAVEIVRQGSSASHAASQTGLKPHAVLAACHKAGVTIRWGRWHERPEREARVRELHAQGKNVTAIIHTIRSEGDPINASWLHNNMPEIVTRRFVAGQQPRVSPPSRERKVRAPRASVPCPDEIHWSDDRVALLKSRWRDGMSAQDIADEFGSSFTRNMVLGKLHRLRRAGALFE